MKKRMLIMLLIVTLVFGAIFGFQVFKNHMIHKFLAAHGAPPQTVATMTASYSTWRPEITAVGNIVAASGVNLAPEVSGLVSHIYFHSGGRAQAGQPLLALDAAPDLGRLRALRASANLARSIAARDLKEYRIGAISKAVVDTDRATLESAEAQVAEQQAIVNEKLLRAPFTGQLGIRMVSLGQYIPPGTPIVALQALDPLYVDFYVPQQLLVQLAPGNAVTVISDALPGRRWDGHITALNPVVDTATRNALVRARLPNPQNQLRPGMFAVVHIQHGPTQAWLTLPQTAVVYNPYGNTVFIVQRRVGPHGKATLVAEQRFVRTGLTRGDQVAILSGIRAGDQVITAGQIKLHNGTPVLINNTIEPANDPAPRPADD